MQIAVLGMGRMGHAAAARLLEKGHSVTVWNRSGGKADDLVERGATEAPSPAKAAPGAEIVVLSLADDAAVEAVVHGDGGLEGALDEGAYLVDASTVSPQTAAALAESFPGRTLASPIMGAPQAVESGKATYLVSGPKDVFDAVAPLFESLAESSDQVRYFGSDPAAAVRIKLLGNYLLLTGIAVLGELIPAARAAGVEESALRSFLESSPMVAPGLGNRVTAMLEGNHAGWFAAALGAKDVRLAEELGSREGLRLPIAELVKRRYEEAVDQGFGGDDITAVMELIRPPG